MSISYVKVSKHPKIFLQITGVNLEQFNIIISEIREKWEKEIINNKKCHGRTSNLPTLEDKVFCLLIYYRTYITHTLLGLLCNLDNSNICRLFKKLEPFMAKKIHIKRDKTLTYDKLLEILADVTESPTQKPKKKQRQKYSGKKKRHTNKTEIVMKKDGKIIAVSRTYGGRTHDFKIRKRSKPLPYLAKTYVDSGYQGLQKVQQNVVLPFKRRRNVPLTEEQRFYNTKLASTRIKIEHKFRQIKIFRILKDTYRNFQKDFNMRFNIIAQIVNLKSGFAMA